MKKYRWLYLCTDQLRLRATLEYLPKEPPVNLASMIVCFPSHQYPYEQDLVNTMKMFAPSWLSWAVYDVSRIGGSFYPTGMSEYFYGQDGLRANWAIGPILTLPCIFEAPFLFTDDDVLLLNDPQPIIDRCNGRWGATNMLSKVPDYVCQGLGEVFDIPNFTPEVYAQHRLGGGVWFVDDTKDWAQRLWRYGQMDYVHRLLTEKKNSWEARRFTQRFLTAWGTKYDYTPVKSSLEVKTIYQTLDKFNLDTCLRNRIFFHYAVPHPNKTEWTVALIKRAEGRS